MATRMASFVRENQLAKISSKENLQQDY